MRDAERIWARCSGTESGDGCWEWTGAIAENGYGRVGKDYVHRVAYRLVMGDIPDGHDVRHRCDNRKCCNPSHLLTGTRSQNMQDCVARGRLWTPWADRNPLAKLDWDSVKSIRSRHASGESMRSIGRAFGVTHGTVSRVVNERGWKPEWERKP
ncbi:MAG: HNH endonuclease [Solirubrobacterales bacterium]